MRLQAFAGLPADGVAGPATLPRSLARRSAHPRCAGRSPLRSATATARAATSFHAGLDFPASTGTAITAAASGRVIFAGYDDGWGLTVVLDHGNGLHTRYAHLSAAAGRRRRLSRRRRPRRPRRPDRLRDRPAPALRGHGPRSERRPRPCAWAAIGSGARLYGDALEAQLEHGEVEQDRAFVAALDQAISAGVGAGAAMQQASARAGREPER